jgi:FHS family glucose/mannose:H+ symporter-like MFS transporter
MPRSTHSRGAMLVLLHPAMALTGVGCAITGPLLPALARSFHLNDDQSGLLVFCIYAGMTAGALLCRRHHARLIAGGFVAFAAVSLGLASAPEFLLFPLAFFYGLTVSLPMTSVNVFAGHNYPARRAATLTALNFTWSLGATLGPLAAARLLELFSWRAVYQALAATALVASVASALILRDSEEAMQPAPRTEGLRNLRLIVLFALFFFLQVGMECTAGAWASTYVLRVTTTTVALAAAASSIFWGGFLVSRALAPLVLLRVRPARLLLACMLTAIAASVVIVLVRSAVPLLAAILLLGLALAPVFPVALSGFFDRARRSSDSRFVLALSAFGGAVFPWLAGAISTHSGSLRIGLLTLPVTLLVMAAMLPLLGVVGRASATVELREQEVAP